MLFIVSYMVIKIESVLCRLLIDKGDNMNNSKMLASKMKQLAILCLMFTGALCLSPALAEKPKSDDALKQKASKQEIAQKLDPYFQTLADNNRLLGRFA